MKFLKKMEWLACLTSIMLMSAPVLAIRPGKKATATEKFTSTIEAFCGSPMDFPIIIALLALVVILIIVIILKSRSGGGYEYWHTEAFGSYFRTRAMKIILIGNKKTEDIKKIFSTMKEKIAKVENLKYQIEQRDLHDDDKDTRKIGGDSGSNAPTQFSDQPATIALREKLRTAEGDLKKFVEQFGTVAKLEDNIRKLIELDSAMKDAWKIMKTVPGFDPDDFKAPWD